MPNPGRPPSGPPLLTLRPRERRLALIAGSLIGCWMLVSLLLQPLWGQLQTLRQHVETQREKAVALHRLMGQGPALEQARAALAGYFVDGDSEQAHGVFLGELEQLSRKAGLRLNLKPRAGRREGEATRFDVELVVEGSQPGLLAFLDELLQMPRLVIVDRIRLARLPAEADLLRATLALHTLVLSSP